MNQYLIPANSKRSMLILGLFAPIDLIILGVGGCLTLVLLIAINASTLKDVIVILTPLLIACAMVAPVPNHRNIWNLTANVYNYFSNRRTYYWRGWCVINGEEKDGDKQ